MKTVQGFVKLGWVVGLAAVLVACGGAPSEADIQKALEQEIQLQIDQAAGSNSGADVKETMAALMPKVEKVLLHVCEALADGAYRCSIEAITSIKQRKMTRRDSVQMTKSPSGEWVISR